MRAKTTNTHSSISRDDSITNANDSEQDDANEARYGVATQTLLDVYALPVPPHSAFLASVGREPGFADLDLDELETYARVAHYRARVLTQQHVSVAQLDAKRVTPSWLAAFERAVAMVTELQQQQQQQQQQQHSHTSLHSDVAPSPARPSHLTHIHSRVVFQLTAVLQQYVRSFGETLFTRELQSLVQRLSSWRVHHVSALLTALEGVKAVGVREEKQRNLEFRHVFRDV